MFDLGRVIYLRMNRLYEAVQPASITTIKGVLADASAGYKSTLAK